jgi:hypothetical protein
MLNVSFSAFTVGFDEKVFSIEDYKILVAANNLVDGYVYYTLDNQISDVFSPTLKEYLHEIPTWATGVLWRGR